jgi:hypothetical protein
MRSAEQVKSRLASNSPAGHYRSIDIFSFSLLIRSIVLEHCMMASKCSFAFCTDTTLPVIGSTSMDAC